jgi:hypothetical protein
MENLFIGAHNLIRGKERHAGSGINPDKNRQVKMRKMLIKIRGYGFWIETISFYRLSSR